MAIDTHKLITATIAYRESTYDQISKFIHRWGKGS